MKITCPECLERFDISPDMVGKKAKCGECAHIFVVPEVAEKKVKKYKWEPEEAKDIRQTAWLSLYLAGLCVGLNIVSGQQSVMTSIPLIIMSLAMGLASTYLVWRGFWSVWPLRQQDKETHLVQTAIIVNGILLGLMAFSLLILVITLISGPSSGGTGGLGGLGDILKNVTEMQKQINKLAP